MKTLLFLLLFVQEKDPNEALQKRVDQLSKIVARMTQSDFKTPVKVEWQKREAFKETLTRSAKTQDPNEGTPPATLAYQLLGLLPQKSDPVNQTVQVMAVQTGAYYDPKTKKIHVLAGKMTADTLNALLVHELVHAMQDQLFDLTKLRMTAGEKKNHDCRMAINFLIEGEASFWTQIFQLATMGDNFDELPEAAQKMVFSGYKSLTSKGIISKLTSGAKGKNATEDAKRAAAQLKNTPPIIIRKHNDPYLRGMYAMYQAWKNTGPTGIRTYFRNPPSCTRDVMFADNRGKLVEVRKVTLPDLGNKLGEGWKNIFEDTGGSITWHTLFEENRKVADKIGQDWTGDRLQVWQKDNNAFMVGRITFHTKDAAHSFARNLEKLYRNTWYKGVVVEKKKAKYIHLVVDTDGLLIQKRDTEVSFARGAFPQALTKEIPGD